jgi:hypothetical protein
MIPTSPYRSGISTKGLFALICISAIVGLLLATCHQLTAPQFPAPAEQIDTSWIEDHSQIPSEAEEDSIVFRNNKTGLMMYHGDRVVAMRPNKTWHWLVLDSVGFNIAIAKAKRRDSL